MTRTAALAAALALVGAAGASAAPGPVFAIVPDTATALPSADAPNGPGQISLPISFTTPPLVQRRMEFADLNGVWRRAGAAYGIPWQVLAAINKVESNFGRNMGPSSAGAVGWMQFMPSTWLRWGTDASGDGMADPWDPEDAVFSASRYLAAAGGREDLYRGVYAYNHADWYVREVLGLASVFGNGDGAVTFTLDRLQVQLDDARKEVTRANGVLVEAVRAERSARRLERRLLRKAGAAVLVSDRLDLERRAAQAGFRADRAADRVKTSREALDAAKAALDAARAGAAPATMSTAVGQLLGSPASAGGYVFPVGGGPGVVSVSHHHHDYPAADIAAPEGAPLYALTDGFVMDAWPLGSGNCGIGFKLAAGDGRTWTYCHMSFLEPLVQPGVSLAAGAPVGIVGSTGHATGPHLHLQTGPELAYPQAEPWFQALAGTAFAWQDSDETNPWPVQQFSTGFGAAERPVFEVVSNEPDVVEFTLGS